MTDISYLVSAIIPLIIGYARAADNIVAQPFKESFVRYLNRNSDDNSYYMTVHSFEAVLGHQFISLKFFFRSLLVSLTFISIFSLNKYLWDPG
jgi:hypothetical protein